MEDNPIRIIFTLAAGALLAGCSIPYSQVPPTPEPAVALPDQFAAAEAAGMRESPHETLHTAVAWWESFADPVLNQVVEAVLETNFDLAQAVARVEQARARARIANALAYPLVNPVAGIDDFDIPTNAGIGAQLDELGLGSELTDAFGLSLPDRVGLTTYTLGAEFAYEVDFWGRNRNTRLAAGAQRLASESDYVAARIAVLAETVRAYLELVDLRRQRELALENIKLLDERESLARSRYESGLIDALGWYAMRKALREARGGLPPLEAGLAEAEARLWILLGGYRNDIDGLLPDALSIAGGEPVPVGIPADLLVQRPDVAGARRRMEAARFTLGARRAELLPALSLSGSIGLQVTDAGDWFDADQWFRNLGVNLLGPAIQGSRLRDNVELAEAQLHEAAAAYRSSVVTAVSEVEAALAGLGAGRRRHDALVSLLDAVQAELALRSEMYSAGIGGYEEVLRVAQIHVGAEAALAAAERDFSLARLALHRALGGAWTAEDMQYLSNE